MSDSDLDAIEKSTATARARSVALRWLMIASTLIVGIAFGVSSASGHGVAPTVEADHAFVADPLASLDGSGLFALAADTRQGKRAPRR
jgi:hypothetical protein